MRGLLIASAIVAVECWIVVSSPDAPAAAALLLSPLIGAGRARYRFSEHFPHIKGGLRGRLVQVPILAVLGLSYLAFLGAARGFPARHFSR